MRNRKLLFKSTPKQTFQRYSFREGTVQNSRYASSLPVHKYALKIYNNCLVKLYFVCILCFSRICFHFAIFALRFHSSLIALSLSLFLLCLSFLSSNLIMLLPLLSLRLFIYLSSLIWISHFSSAHSHFLLFFLFLLPHFFLNFKSVPFISHHRLDVATLKTGSVQMDRYSNKNCRDFHFVMTQLSPPLFLFLIQVSIHRFCFVFSIHLFKSSPFLNVARTNVQKPRHH